MAADRFDQVAQRWLNDASPNYGLENFQPDDIVVAFVTCTELKRLKGWNLGSYFTVVKNREEANKLLKSIDVVPSPLYTSVALFWLWDQWTKMPSSSGKIYVPPEVLVHDQSVHRKPMPTIRGAEVSLVVEDEVVAAKTAPTPVAQPLACVLTDHGKIMKVTLSWETAEEWASKSPYHSYESYPIV